MNDQDTIFQLLFQRMVVALERTAEASEQQAKTSAEMLSHYKWHSRASLMLMGMENVKADVSEMAKEPE